MALVDEYGYEITDPWHEPGWDIHAPVTLPDDDDDYSPNPLAAEPVEDTGGETWQPDEDTEKEKPAPNPLTTGQSEPEPVIPEAPEEKEKPEEAVQPVLVTSTDNSNKGFQANAGKVESQDETEFYSGITDRQTEEPNNTSQSFQNANAGNPFVTDPALLAAQEAARNQFENTFGYNPLAGNTTPVYVNPDGSFNREAWWGLSDDARNASLSDPLVQAGLRGWENTVNQIPANQPQGMTAEQLAARRMEAAERNRLMQNQAAVNSSIEYANQEQNRVGNGYTPVSDLRDYPAIQPETNPAANPTGYEREVRKADAPNPINDGAPGGGYDPRDTSLLEAQEAAREAYEYNFGVNPLTGESTDTVQPGGGYDPRDQALIEAREQARRRFENEFGVNPLSGGKPGNSFEPPASFANNGTVPETNPAYDPEEIKQQNEERRTDWEQANGNPFYDNYTPGIVTVTDQFRQPYTFDPAAFRADQYAKNLGDMINWDGSRTFNDAIYFFNHELDNTGLREEFKDILSSDMMGSMGFGSQNGRGTNFYDWFFGSDYGENPNLGISQTETVNMSEEKFNQRVNELIDSSQAIQEWMYAVDKWLNEKYDPNDPNSLTKEQKLKMFPPGINGKDIKDAKDLFVYAFCKKPVGKSGKKGSGTGYSSYAYRASGGGGGRGGGGGGGSYSGGGSNNNNGAKTSRIYNIMKNWSF